MTERISKNITRHRQTPKDKYDYPMTSSQTYGWYSKPVSYIYQLQYLLQFKQNKMFDKPIAETPISKYVADYYKFMGTNPFKLPSSSFKMK